MSIPLFNNIEKREDNFVIYFDGCCKGNPGPGGAGAVLYKNDKEIWSDCMFVGEKVTNNISEYAGLLMGLQFATNQSNIKNLIIKGDSLLVIKQMKGEYKVNSENIKELFKKAKEYEKQIGNVEYLHVYRKDNKRADELSNKGLSNKGLSNKGLLISNQRNI
jgi:ribonuclease HI